MKELIEAEAENYDANLKALGDTAELVRDFEKLYEALIKCLKSSTSEPGSLVGGAAPYLLAFCRGQLTMGVLALLRSYRGDSLLHTRRAIESCAFVVRICKHPDLEAVWGRGGSDEGSYANYRSAFKTRDVFPNPKHPDHEPALSKLKGRYDSCSRLMHGGILGLATHFHTTPERFHWTPFDLPPDHSLFSTFFWVLNSHKEMLHLLGRILDPRTNDQMAAWKVRVNSAEAKLVVHQQRWIPMIQQGMSKRRK